MPFPHGGAPPFDYLTNASPYWSQYGWDVGATNSGWNTIVLGLPDNNDNYITAKAVRDPLWTLWNLVGVALSQTAATGSTGIQGPQGRQGNIGLQGRQGVVGGTGFQGLQGFQGSQGNIGFQGMQGPTGDPNGPIGPTGFQGRQGISGGSGIQGFQGPIGFQGFQGRGNTGFQGFGGPTGVQGWQGMTGGPGLPGNPGGTGQQGPQGWQGLGNTGFQGIEGPTGVQGWQGIGNTGFQGLQGWQGFQGNQGRQGAGNTGFQGMQGPLSMGMTGSGAFTITTLPQTMPPCGGTVSLSVQNSSWASIGQPVYVGPNIGHFEVVGPLSATPSILQLLNICYPSNVAPGTPIPVNSTVSPSGPVGPTGSGGTMSGPQGWQGWQGDIGFQGWQGPLPSPTFSGINLGTGAGVFEDWNVNEIQLLSLEAGPGQDITRVGDNLVFSVTSGGGSGAGVSGTALVGAWFNNSIGITMSTTGSRTTVQFPSIGLSVATITKSGNSEEFTFNKSGKFKVSAKATLFPGSNYYSHWIIAQVFAGGIWTDVPNSLSYGYTPNNSNDQQTIHTGEFPLQVVTGNRVRIQMQTLAGSLTPMIASYSTALSIEEAVGPIWEVIDVTGTTYSLSIDNSGKILRFTNNSAIVCTLIDSLPVSFACKAIQDGNGQITFSPSGTAVLNNRQSFTKTAGQYAMVELTVKQNSSGSVYLLSGDGAV